MAVMVSQSTFTRRDLDALPVDGHRYELLDGAIVMSPSPGLSHQRVALRVCSMLAEVAHGTAFEAVIAPWDVEFGLSVLVPDVVVASSDGLHERGLDGVPLLVVEVVSPSTRRIDETAKREIYQQFGVRQYWLVDPQVPSTVVLELEEGVYREVAVLAGDSMMADLRSLAQALLTRQ